MVCDSKITCPLEFVKPYLIGQLCPVDIVSELFQIIVVEIIRNSLWYLECLFLISVFIMKKI